MRFVMKLEMTPEELAACKECDLNCSKHISVVNDIYSWEKELLKSQDSQEDGSALCSSVQVITQETNVPIEASKRILWSMCREWELVHLELVDKLRKLGHGNRVLIYCKGLEYQMSGNELWSSATKRYVGLEVQ
jgi:aristolochene synthase